jgi:crossover junction endodeoxyribonuclease RuvC
MIILGIDPGYALIGYGLIENIGNQLRPVHYHHISTSASLSFFDRMIQINQELKALIKRYQPEEMAIEKLYFSKNTKTAMAVAQVRGAIIQEALNSGMRVYEYDPSAVKIAVTGYGRAEKDQVQKMVKSLLNLETIPKPDDTADALAIAICHHNSSKIADLARRY